jgi:TRAP-type uncharacterized transport system fused permease subunit
MNINKLSIPFLISLIALENGGNALFTIAITCGCAGVVVGMMMKTGLGMSLLVDSGKSCAW